MSNEYVCIEDYRRMEATLADLKRVIGQQREEIARQGRTIEALRKANRAWHKADMERRLA